MPSKTFQVPNISCGHCTRTIENEINDLDHIISVSADKDTKTVVVEWETPQTWENINDLLIEINYPPAE